MHRPLYDRYIDSPHSWISISSVLKEERLCKVFSQTGNWGDTPVPNPVKGNVWCCPGSKMARAARCKAKGTKNELATAPLTVWAGAKKGSPRLFCMVYTTANRVQKINAQKEWAQRCDKHIFMGDQDLPELPMVKLRFEGPKTYLNMWRKLHTMWQYVHDHYIDDFDYFYTAGDDVFMIVENMRRFLLSAEVVAQHAAGHGVYIGHRISTRKGEIFNAGGPGYVLDRVGVATVVENAKKGGLDITPVEDVKVGKIMQGEGIMPMHTEDGVSQRFHLFAPDFYLDFNPNSEKDKDGWVTKGERTLKPGFVAGQAGISNKSIAFHYCDLECLWELSRLIYECKEPQSH